MDVNAYLSLIPYQTRTIQYPSGNDNPPLPSRFERLLESILQPIADMGSMFENVDSNSIDSAVGPVLDYYGQAVGISRELIQNPSSGESFMSDDEYRAILKLRIAQMMWDGGNKDAAEIYKSTLSSLADISYVDNQNGTISITFSNVGETRIAEIVAMYYGYLVPAGVGADVTIVGLGIPVTGNGGIGVFGMDMRIQIRMINEEPDLTVGDLNDMDVSDVTGFAVRQID